MLFLKPTLECLVISFSQSISLSSKFTFVNIGPCVHESNHAYSGRHVNFNLILPKVNTDYIRQEEVMNIDNLKLIKLLMNF